MKFGLSGLADELSKIRVALTNAVSDWITIDGSVMTAQSGDGVSLCYSVNIAHDLVFFDSAQASSFEKMALI